MIYYPYGIPTSRLSEPIRRLMERFSTKGSAAVEFKMKLTRANLHSMATAVEVFHVDNYRYPPSVPGASEHSINHRSRIAGRMPAFSTFAASASAPNGLTSSWSPDQRSLTFNWGSVVSITTPESEGIARRSSKSMG